MELEQRKIFSNTTFDIDILKLVLKRNWYWCLLVLILFISSAFLYLRYTKPIYESNILIQINSENQSADILGIKDIRQTLSNNTSLSKEIELLRSKMLFQRALSDLPLEVTYYAQGEFLTETRYKNTNLEVEVIQLKDSSLVNTPIYICMEGSDVVLEFEKGGVKQLVRSDINSAVISPFFNLSLNIGDLARFQNDCATNKLYFVINDINTLTKQFHPLLSIDPIDYGARTVEISFRSHSGTLATDVVSSLANHFFKYYEELKKESAENILEFIDVQLDSLRVELAMSKDSVMEFRRREQINDPEFLNSSLIGKIARLKEEESVVNEELRVLKTVKNKLQSNSNSVEIYRLIPIIIGQSYEGSLNQQIKGFYDLIDQRENLAFKVTADNEAMRRIEERIELRKEIIDDIIESLFEKSNEKLKIVQGKLSEEEGRFDLVPEKQMELARLVEIQGLNEKYYTMLSEKKVMYAISNAGYSSDNKILSNATVPTIPVFPIKWMMYGLAVFVGLVFSIGFLAIRYLSYDEISQISDLQAIIPSHVGFLGAVPFRDLKKEYSHLIVDKYPKSSLSEAFRSLRINLSFIKREVKTLSLTSTVSQEGKTFIALNLGGVIAMSGKKVLVVDLDMRKPKIHLGFDKPNRKGMSNLLAGHYSIDEVLQKSDLAGLDFISAGPIPPNPSELLLKPELDGIIEELKERYDVVIFDNPPIGIVSDGVPLLSKVDVPIYIFRANYSKRYFVDGLKDVVGMKDLTNLYIVLNGVQKNKSNYGNYNYGHGYYVED